jgi:hypothetical protein
MARKVMSRTRGEVESEGEAHTGEADVWLLVHESSLWTEF